MRSKPYTEITHEGEIVEVQFYIGERVINKS